MASTLPTPASCCSTFTQITDTCEVTVEGESGGSPQAYDTVVDLRAEETHADGTVAFTKGRASVSDLEGATYIYYEASVVADDGYNSLQPDNVSGAGRWIRTGTTP